MTTRPLDVSFKIRRVCPSVMQSGNKLSKLHSPKQKDHMLPDQLNAYGFSDAFFSFVWGDWRGGMQDVVQCLT